MGKKERTQAAVGAMAAARSPKTESPHHSPWYRLEYERAHQRVLADSHERNPKFKIYELVGAFLTMRRREAGINARESPAKAQAYEFQTLQGLLHWIPGRDAEVDRLRNDLRVIVKGDPEGEHKIDEALEKHLEEKKRIFNEAQRSRAQLPRKERGNPLDDYIYEVLKKNFSISAEHLLRRIETDVNCDVPPADYIEEVTAEKIIAVDPVTGAKAKTTLGGLRTRLSKVRKEFPKK